VVLGSYGEIIPTTKVDLFLFCEDSGNADLFSVDVIYGFLLSCSSHVVCIYRVFTYLYIF